MPTDVRIDSLNSTEFARLKVPEPSPYINTGEVIEFEKEGYSSFHIERPALQPTIKSKFPSPLTSNKSIAVAYQSEERSLIRALELNVKSPLLELNVGEYLTALLS